MPKETSKDEVGVQSGIANGLCNEKFAVCSPRTGRVSALTAPQTTLSQL